MGDEHQSDVTPLPAGAQTPLDAIEAWGLLHAPGEVVYRVLRAHGQAPAEQVRHLLRAQLFLTRHLARVAASAGVEVRFQVCAPREG